MLLSHSKVFSPFYSSSVERPMERLLSSTREGPTVGEDDSSTTKKAKGVQLSAPMLHMHTLCSFSFLFVFLVLLQKK